MIARPRIVSIGPSLFLLLGLSAMRAETPQPARAATPSSPEHRAASEGHWPSFRGPSASGIGQGSTRTQWSVAANEGIAWKTKVDGLGLSSPIVWGDRVFVTTAVPASGKAELKVGLYGDIAPVEETTPQRFELWCLDRKTGAVLWKRTAYEGVPKIKRHTKASHANSTPATDGKRVVAFFGSEGLYAYDLDGKLLWKKDLGRLDAGYFRVPEAQWGFGSSPVIHDDKIVVQCDVQTGSFLAALAADDGRELWRTSRDEVPTWSSPTIHAGPQVTQVIVNGWRHIGAYDLATGKELWKLRGGGDIPVPTPVVAHGLAFLTNAHGGAAPIFAIRLEARGDLSLAGEATSNAGVAWSVPKNGAYMQTPLVYGDELYVCKDNGTLTVLEARTGKPLYQQRLGGGSSGFTASPVAADGKVYFTSEIGEVYVVRAGSRFELLAENALDEVCMATPAVSRGALLFRTRGQVVAVQ